MTQQQKKNGSIIAIVTMMFLYAMIGFVTNLAAPIGNVMKYDPEVGDSNFLAMMGNFMNFLAYLLLGIPAGKILSKKGYKKTAMLGVALGFIGILVQFISGFEAFEGYSDNILYLIGAFIAGMSVCLLNTVVNPMLNLLGGGGKRGNQLNMIGGTFNSLAATIAPILVGALIGEVTNTTDFVDINIALYIAMAIFAATFVILAIIPIEQPEIGKITSSTKFEHSPWKFRHFVLGAIGVFIYVGIEVGIPSTLNNYLSDATSTGGGLTEENAKIVGGMVYGMFMLMMLIGRIFGGSIANKVSSKNMLVFTSVVGILLIATAIFIPKTITTSMPFFKSETGSFMIETVPFSALLLIMCGLCTSVMWPCIFNLATEGLGKYTVPASGIFMMMVFGGGVLPQIQSAIADSTLGYMISYIVPLIGLAYLCFYAIAGSKNVNTDIPVE